MTIANALSIIFITILIAILLSLMYYAIGRIIMSEHEKRRAHLIAERDRKLFVIKCKILWIDIKQAWRKLDYHADKLFKRKKPK